MHFAIRNIFVCVSSFLSRCSFSELIFLSVLCITNLYNSEYKFNFVFPTKKQNKIRCTLHRAEHADGYKRARRVCSD